MDATKELVHLARLVVTERQDDVPMLIRRAMRGVIRERADLAEQAQAVLKNLDSDSLARSNQSKAPLPVDLDSRLELIRRESVPLVDPETQWPRPVADELQATVNERRQESELFNAGLTPTRSLLFVGPPGVGKTLAARWLAARLERPLLTLDLSAVMSSFLGRTGSNIRVVLDYARRSRCVLLLDEFDAIAKRRDDASEIGELKRLVTVLLQEVDNWPADGILIAATNHPELLDPAVWRRFDRVVTFPLPNVTELRQAIVNLIGEMATPAERQLADIMAAAFVGKSFSEVVRQLNNARREAIIEGRSLTSVFEGLVQSALHLEGDHGNRIDIALSLLELGYSQRNAQALTGVSRDTIRKYSSSQPRKSVSVNQPGNKHAERK